jgi:hypothetical protein
MRCHWISWTVLATALGLAVPTYAVRRPEARSEATHVIVGTVEGVYVREKEDTRHYLVEISIEKVEKGDGFKPGGTFYVGCYLWTPDYYKGKKLSPQEKERLGYRGWAYESVPKEGERVRVYAKHAAKYANGGPGRYDGIYPRWYEVLKGK